MKKFYFAAVMALSAAMVGVANNTPLKHVGHTLHDATNPEKGIVFNPSKAPSLDAQTIKSIATKTGRLNTSTPSRAEESETFNFADYTIWTFLDPEVNYYDDNGNQLSSPTYIISSTETVIREVGDSVEINWYYYTDIPFMYKFYVTSNDEGNPILKLGQPVADGPIRFYVTDQNGVQKEKLYNMILGGGFIEPDPENPDSPGNLVFKETGDVQFYLTDDPNVITMDAYSLYVLLEDVDDPSAQKTIYNELLLNRLCKPNATLAYQFYTINDDNEPVLEDINEMVYYSFDENSYAPYPDEPDTVYDSYFVSNVTPFGMGLGVHIARFEVEEDYSPTGFLWMADSQPAFPSQVIGTNSTGQPILSGKMYMNSVYIDSEDFFTFYDPEYPQITFKEGTYTDVNGKEYSALTFPNNLPDCLDEMSYWGISSKVQNYANGYYTPAVLVFDFVGNAFEGKPYPDTDGIQDVIQDTYEGAPEYYDLQGIKVANPAPGKIYIVKEGSKVTKRIF